MTVQQIETATVVGTITLAGNAKAVITSAYMPNSPKTVSFAVLLGDNASAVALAARSALGVDADVTSIFAVSGTGANIVLTSHVARANDTTLNIATDNNGCTGLTAAPTSVDTLAGSGINNGYATLAEFKLYASARGETASTWANDDAPIEDIIEACSRYIDGATARRFYVDTSNTAYYYTAEDLHVLFIPDFASIASIAIDDGTYTWGTTLSSSDFVTLPPNTTAEGTPITRIEVRWDSSYTFPKYRNGVKITGKQGWPSVPDDIKNACLMIAQNVYAERSGQSSSGNVTVTAAGVVIRPNSVPDIAAQILMKYKRWV